MEALPAFEQKDTYSAEVLRHVFGSLLQRGAAIGSIAGGLVGATDMQVTAGSGMQVVVAVGEAWIPGSSVSTQGGYLGRVTSSTALAISASNESLPRIETIIAQVKDSAVAGGEDSFTVSVVVGTAESGATLANKKGAGAVPASSLVLAYILIAAKAIIPTEIENVAGLLEGALPPGDGTVDTNALANGAVTDAKVTAGRALVETGNAYTRQNRAFATLYQASTTRTALVIVSFETQASEEIASCVVHVGRTGVGEGGVIAGEGKFRQAAVAGLYFQSITFLVPPGVKYEYVGSAKALGDSFILL